MDIHPGLLKMVNKMVEEATSPEIESDYIHTRLKNDILVVLLLANVISRSKSKNMA